MITYHTPPAKPEHNAPPHIVVYSLQGVKDPLFSGLIYSYLKKLNANKTYRFHVITHEQAAYAYTPEEEQQMRQEMAENGISWYPVQYHTGPLVLLNRLKDFMQSLKYAAFIKKKFKPRMILGYLVIAGGFAYLLSRIFRWDFALYCFEPHSEYMLDFGTWSKSSLKYRILNFIEKLEVKNALYLTVPTTHTEALVRSWKPKAKQIFTVPISIDTDKFVFDEAFNQNFREKNNLQEREIWLYVGKFDGIYYSAKEVAEFYKQAILLRPQVFGFLITTLPKQEVETAFWGAGLNPEDILVLDKVPYKDIDKYMAVADLGIVAIPPLPSQKFRTPVKVGNYLSCGVPYLIVRGIADDDALAEMERVGVVCESLSYAHIAEAMPRIDLLLSSPKKLLRERCRQTAVKFRGLHNSVTVLHEIFKRMHLTR